MRAVAMSLVLLLTLLAWSAHSHADGTVFKRVDATFFTFDIPAYMAKTQVEGIDSYVGEYESSNIRLGFDYGSNADPLSYDRRLPQYKMDEVWVDGRKARIVSFYQVDAWFTAIHFPVAGRNSDERFKLTMHATCKTANDLRVAQDAFASVHFK